MTGILPPGDGSVTMFCYDGADNVIYTWWDHQTNLYNVRVDRENASPVTTSFTYEAFTMATSKPADLVYDHMKKLYHNDKKLLDGLKVILTGPLYTVGKNDSWADFGEATKKAAEAVTYFTDTWYSNSWLAKQATPVYDSLKFQFPDYQQSVWFEDDTGQIVQGPHHLSDKGLAEISISQMAHQLPGMNYLTTCPLTNCDYSGKATKYTLYTLVQHLNDEHRQTRDQIADWVETLDCDINFKVKETV